MKKAMNWSKNIKVLLVLVVLFMFLGCEKESPCKSVVQGDFILVE